MGYPLKLNQTAQPLIFLLVQSADHISPATGKTPTVTLSKNGGAFASPAGAVSEIGSGWYKVAGNATDANTLGPLALHATASGADPSDDRFDVVAFDPQSATNLGLTNLDATVSTRLPTSSYTAPDNSDIMAIKAKTDLIATNGMDSPNAVTAQTAISTNLAAIYPADVQVTFDDADAQDSYTVIWFENGTPVSDGITSPLIEVINQADGTDLISQTAMVEVGSSGVYKHDEATHRIIAGQPVIVTVTATINAGTRTWSKIVGRDD